MRGYATHRALARRLSLSAFAAVVSVGSAVPAFGAEDQTVIEEIVVTGSLIRRDSFDSPSPLTVVGQDEIEDNATPNLGEVLVNQTFNYGTDFQTNTYAARSQIGTDTAANLRGLGERATLNLLDGKRGGGGNLNSALPQIAIERIDILKDGASATYGTDAVAGVVNIIPRDDFSGAEVQWSLRVGGLVQHAKHARANRTAGVPARRVRDVGDGESGYVARAGA